MLDLNSHSNHRARLVRRATAAAAACTALLVLPVSPATAGSGGVSTDSGGSGKRCINRTVPGDQAKLKRNGKAKPPANAPRRVRRAICAGNRIDNKGYCLGGGHRRWKSRCYDCSGTVSFALGKYGARIVDSPMPSGSYTRWGKRGKGKWITVYANSGHMFAVIAGLRLDTSMPDDGERGPGWSKRVRVGFRNVSRTTARHWRKL